MVKCDLKSNQENKPGFDFVCYIWLYFIFSEPEIWQKKSLPSFSFKMWTKPKKQQQNRQSDTFIYSHVAAELKYVW